MDSFSLHFERMSNVDLHPLSLPISRLSPAKSNSSIVDQFAHHQHGKGDSAYSSFSGGSTAPDYPSPFLTEDLHSNSFSHYADLKYVKSIYHPTQVLQSDSKTMDQLCRSVEAISKHYNNNTSTNQNGNDGFRTNKKALSKQDMAPSQSAYAPVRPPPVPARLDSFIATKNLENSRGHHHELQTQQLQPEQQPRPYSLPHLPPHGGNAPRPETPNPDTGNANLNCEPVYSVWRGPQQQQPQGQQLPSYRPHLQPHDQTRPPLNPEYLFIMDNKAAPEQQKSTNLLSRSPPRGTSQPDQLQPRQPSTGGGCNGDHHNKPCGTSSHFESRRKRAHSAHDALGEPIRASSPWNAGPGFINSSIQHKGQFYFVTGVCKLSESGMRTHSASLSGPEAASESSKVLEKYHLRERERSHSTMDNFFRPLQDSSCASSGTISVERESVTPVPQDGDLFSRSLDQENHRPSLFSKSSRSFDALEDVDVIHSRDIGRHTPSNPIFYCGPDRNISPPLAAQTNEVTTLISNEHPYQHCKDEQAKRGKRQPLGDVASERINKETTPLLYHLTGASRAMLQPKKEMVLNKTPHVDVALNDNERTSQVDVSKSERGDIMPVECNTLDDSFKKYYKEKLKDAQSKVLRETSFKRRDLQLSWPHRIRQKPELRPTVIHSFYPSEGSETSTDTLTPSVTSEDTERGGIKEEIEETQANVDKETEKENGRPANVAQPQVARIGGRKRLTPDQKKMCYSVPEKLNQLGRVPSHSACRSFGNESENAFVVESQGEEREQHGEQGLVAARRKMFESRGRALSASSALKTNLKNLQHKALVEYMERKTGQKVAEPQQPALHVPPPARQRHSLGERPFDWGPRPLSGSHEVKNTKKKSHRPHSAGRILDSSTSSARYAQFFSAQSCSGQSDQPRWRQSKGSHQAKCVSVESLLDQTEPPSFFRNRSTSTPHAFETYDYEKNPSPVDTVEPWSPQENATEKPLVKPPAEAQQQVRVVAQRGKSMEELGASKLTRTPALSKSSEQLDQLCRGSSGPGGPNRNTLFINAVSEAKELERRRKNEAKEEICTQKNTQVQNQTQKKSPLKQTCEPPENSSRPTSPASRSSSRARIHSGSHSPVTDEFRGSRSPTESASNPPSPRGPETSEREISSTSSTPTQTKLPCENRPCFRVKTSPSVSGSEREQSVDEPSDDALPLEVSLSCGVTTDPSLWLAPPEDEIKKDVQTSPLTDIFEAESTSSASQKAQPSESSVPPRSSVCDADASQPTGSNKEDSNPEPEDGESGENPEMEERGPPEREMESLERPAERPQWEELVEEVVKADQSLTRVLYPLANRKTALMLMEQLLSEDTLLMEEHYKKKQEQRVTAESAGTVEAAEPGPCPSAPDSLEPQCKHDITEKKRLLLTYIEERLQALEETRAALRTEVRENVARGEALVALVRDRCLPVELERYNLFVGDLERVISLLLCLSARLARVQNALSTVDQHTDAEEKQSLDSRHRLLCKQREDAKDLKDNLDRRESVVSTFLSRQLSAEQLQDYRRFVQTKASLLIQQKDLEEKQKLGEEQLEALSNSLGL